MSTVSSVAVMALREITQLPMMDCKRALEASQGDQAKAIEYLRQQGQKILGQRQSATSEGRIEVATSADGLVVGMIELQCESAPVANSTSFRYLANQLATRLVEGPGAETPDDLLNQSTPDRPETPLRDLFFELNNQIRERIILARVLRVEGPAGAYVHHDGKTAAVFRATGTGEIQILREVAMHIVALCPQVTSASQVPQTDLQREKDSASREALALNKPPQVIEKIVAGRLRTYLLERGVLTEQPFVMDESQTVGQILPKAGFTAVGFTRWVLGVSR